MITNLNDNDYCKNLRRIYKINLENAAAFINCTEKEITMYEKGTKVLSKEKLKLYLKFLNRYKYII